MLDPATSPAPAERPPLPSTRGCTATRPPRCIHVLAVPTRRSAGFSRACGTVSPISNRQALRQSRLAELSHGSRLGSRRYSTARRRRNQILPRLHPMEERAGERRRVCLFSSGWPLSSVLSPLLRRGERKKAARSGEFAPRATNLGDTNRDRMCARLSTGADGSRMQGHTPSCALKVRLDRDACYSGARNRQPLRH